MMLASRERILLSLPPATSLSLSPCHCACQPLASWKVFKNPSKTFIIFRLLLLPFWVQEEGSSWLVILTIGKGNYKNQKIIAFPLKRCLSNDPLFMFSSLTVLFPFIADSALEEKKEIKIK